MNTKRFLKLDNSNFPTNQPVHFYMLPDNRIYVIYAVEKRKVSSKSPTLKNDFIIERLEEFTCDYEKEDIFDSKGMVFGFFPEFIDKYNQERKLIKHFEKCRSYEKAESLLNEWYKSKHLPKEEEKIM